MSDEDEAGLADTLTRAGAPWTPQALRAVVAGVAAAPPAIDDNAWMDLIIPHPDEDVMARLAALRQRLTRDYEARASDDVLAGRLADLRKDLTRQHLTGFLVPRSDEHQGEQVPACSERLAWLTGFTGSAGTAIVLQDRSALFVDGRYTEQARSEVTLDCWTIHHSLDELPADWLTANLPEHGRVGYDPWLHTPNQLKPFVTACHKLRAHLVAVEENPIDVVWRDRPPPPISPVVVYGQHCAGKPSGEKRREVADILRKERQQAVLLSAPDSIAWLLNIRGGDVPFSPLPLAFSLLHADGWVDLFIDPVKLTAPVRAHLGTEVRIRAPADLGAALDRLGTEGKVVRIDPASTSDWALRRLKASGATLARDSDPCSLPKAIKSPDEIEGIRAAHRRDGVALTRLLAWLSRRTPEASTELEVAAQLEQFRRENLHFRGLSFPTISAFGEHGAIVHYRPSPATDAVLQQGSLYLVDSGAQYLDGTTDVTRTVAIGEPSDAMRKHFTRVLKGHIAIATAVFPEGTTGSQIDALARLALWDAGLDYDHGTGHGVGCYLCVHEGPQRISKLPNPTKLAPGMVVSNEPGYYKLGEYGIRIENLVVVRPVARPEGGERDLLGFETLTLAPIDRTLVEASLLEASEVRWLDNYHGEVRRVLSPLLDEATRQWLDESTQPLIH